MPDASRSARLNSAPLDPAPDVRYRIGREHPDEIIARLAAEQHGHVSRVQLLSAGLSARAIHRRVMSGHLHPVHRGVYAVGHVKVTQRGVWMAAVLAGGPGAVLSHRDAGALWGLGPSWSPVHVTTPKDRRRPGLKIHHAHLAEDERTVRDGIPVTTVARTLLDLAAVLRPDQLERALREAEVQQYADATPVGALLERHRGRPGTANLRAVLPRAGDGRTQSDLEEMFLRFVDDHGLPRPKLNRFVAGKHRDCVYEQQRLVVELDGWWSHGKARFHDDRERDRALLVAGYATVRVTFDHLERDPRGLLDDLRALTVG